jgi:hypothetical protein
MSRYSDNLWAEEMGINLEDLLRESPMHIEQMKLQRKIAKQAAEYWARERFLSRLHSPAPEATYTPPRRGTVTPKQGKVRRYEFTDAQVEIARRSLGAGDSV